ncbi:Uncharacterised protein [Mycobacteroides abscessus]|nr:Uncharacterised protein [Mycobacteroides abscessus]
MDSTPLSPRGDYRDTARGSDRERRLSLAAAEQGVVRFEVELRARALLNRGLDRPSSLRDDELWRLAHTHWRRSAFDHPVGSGGCRLTRMDAEFDWKQSSLVQVYLRSPERCEAQMSPATFRNARRLADRFDLTPADLMPLVGVPEGQLDLDTGRFVHPAETTADRYGYELAS